MDLTPIILKNKVSVLDQIKTYFPEGHSISIEDLSNIPFDFPDECMKKIVKNFDEILKVN